MVFKAKGEADVKEGCGDHFRTVTQYGTCCSLQGRYTRWYVPLRK